MERLTKHRLDNDTNYVSRLKYLFTNEEDAYINGTNKLGQLEDIEEELGIELSVLFNALFNGIYIYDCELHKKINGKVNIIHCSCELGLNVYNELRLLPVFKKEYHRKGHYYIKPIALGMVSLKDYGKTWALDRKELEK